MQKLADGTQLGAYTIVRRIGRGGMGEVYEALERRLQRRVALKVIAPQNSGEHGEGDLVRRFLQEARTLAQINNPNVVTIYSIDNVAGTQFIAMEYVEGAVFKDFTSLFALSGDEAAPIFLQLLEGLKTLHENRILHRDLKPQNLILRRNASIKILDFGIAKRLGDQLHENTTAGVVVGTLAYLPPEVLEGNPATARSDLWSLGAIFYECLVGQPLVGPKREKMKGVRAFADSDVVFPDAALGWIPEEMRRIVGRLCDRRTDARYVSAAEAIAEIQRYVASRPPLESRFSKAIAFNIDHITDLKERMRDKMPKGSKAKRSFWVRMLAGQLPELEDPIVDANSGDLRMEEMPKVFTQVVRESLSDRQRHRPRSSQKPKETYWPWPGAPILAMVVLVGLWLTPRIFSGRSEPVPAPEVHPGAQPVANAPSADAVKLITPAERQALWLGQGQFPVFTWSRLLTSGEYVLQVAWDADFNSVVLNEAVSGNSYRPERGFTEGDYYWRLYPLHPSDVRQPVVHFTISMLAAPEQSQPDAEQVLTIPANQLAVPVDFSWTCKPGAEQYRIQISTTPTFSALADEEHRTECQWNHVNLSAGEYYWRVRVEEPAPPRGLWSAVRKLTVHSSGRGLGTAPPVLPVTQNKRSIQVPPPHLNGHNQVLTLKFNHDGSGRDVASVRKTIAEVPLLGWQPVEGARSYHLQLSHTPDFAQVLSQTTLSSTHYSWADVLPGRTYWRVRAEQPTRGAYSEAGQLDVRLPAPALEATLHPKEGGALDWPSVPLAERYLVQVGTDRNLSSVTERFTAKPQIFLKANDTPTFVRVAAATTNGERVSDFSSTSTVDFNAGAPGKVQLRMPIDNAHVKVGGSGRISVVFSWIPQSSAETYEVQVAIDPDFKDKVEEKTIPTHHSVLREANLHGPVYWRVRGIGPNGPGDWSLVRRFNVE